MREEIANGLPVFKGDASLITTLRLLSILILLTFIIIFYLAIGKALFSPFSFVAL